MSWKDNWYPSFCPIWLVRLPVAVVHLPSGYQHLPDLNTMYKWCIKSLVQGDLHTRVTTVDVRRTHLTMKGCCSQCTSWTFSDLRSAYTESHGPQVVQCYGQLICNWPQVCDGETMDVPVLHISTQAFVQELQVEEDIWSKKKPFHLTILQVSGPRRHSHFNIAISSVTWCTISRWFLLTLMATALLVSLLWHLVTNQNHPAQGGPPLCETGPVCTFYKLV